jgi:hypothetical protein
MTTAPSPSESEFATAEEAEAHDRWFRKEVDAALREADDPATQWVPHDQVMANMDAIIEVAEKKLATRKS